MDEGYFAPEVFKIVHLLCQNYENVAIFIYCFYCRVCFVFGIYKKRYKLLHSSSKAAKLIFSSSSKFANSHTDNPIYRVIQKLSLPKNLLYHLILPFGRLQDMSNQYSQEGGRGRRRNTENI